jgi:hypothetical protein
MQLKKGLKIYSSEPWYDLTDGGYLKPEKMLVKAEDIKRVKDAVEIIQDFFKSCEEQIKDFLQ